MVNYGAVHRRSPLAILQLSISIIQQHHAAQAEAIIKLHPQPQRQILPVVTTSHLYSETVQASGRKDQGK